MGITPRLPASAFSNVGKAAAALPLRNTSGVVDMCKPSGCLL
jgi:hypothetical protein